MWFSLLLATPAQGATLRVCEIGGEYATLVGAANVSLSGDTIQLCPGFHDGNIDLVHDLIIEGEYGSAVTYTTGRFRPQGNTLTLRGLHMVNTGRVIFANPGTVVGSDLILDGGGSTTDDQGGLVFVSGGALDLTDTLIRRRTTTGFGGAIAVMAASTLRAERLTIEDCHSEQHGGAIYVGLGEVDIDNSWFRGNSGEFGGVFSIRNQTSEVVLTGLYANGNTGVTNGGVVEVFESGVQIVDSLFEKNTANSGGAIRAGTSEVTVRNSAMLDNSCDVDGGAIYAVSGTLTLDSSWVCGNQADDDGAGVRTSANDTELVHNLFVGNSAVDKSGAARLETGTAVVHHNTFYGNTAVLEATGVFVEVGAFEHNIIAGHPGGFTPAVGGAATADFNHWDNADPNYTGLVHGPNEAFGDPMFAGPSLTCGADFHLLPGSPAVNAGNPAVVDPDGTAVDLGAYSGNQGPVSAVDADGDGVWETWDCDDNDANRSPGATEVCDTVDNDCDGYVDEEACAGCTTVPYGGTTYIFCTSPVSFAVAEAACATNDYQGVVIDDEDEGVFIAEVARSIQGDAWWIGLEDRDQDGTFLWSTGEVPGFTSWASGQPTVDQNQACVWSQSTTGLWSSDDCSELHGFICEVCVPQLHFPDADGDGWGTGSAQLVCAGEGWARVDGDCDDNSSAIQGPTPWYVDVDVDGFGTGIPVDLCEPPPGYVELDTDCDDTRPGVNPNETEICDGLDTDCNNEIDDIGYTIEYFPDTDLDGCGAAIGTAEMTCTAPAGTVGNNLDCNDNEILACRTTDPDFCGDGVDNNCSGTVDDGDSFTWYPDDDGDDFGNPGNAIVDCVDLSIDHALNDQDCDDANPNTHPGATETCDMEDNDCDGDIDEDAVDTTLFYPDIDGDGFGDPTVASLRCFEGGGFVDNNNDCDDDNAARAPDLPELCDGIDNDCDLEIDEVGAVGEMPWFEDVDDDGYGAGAPLLGCEQPVGTVSVDGDCGPEDPSIYPGAAEIAGDGIDQDCDEFDLEIPQAGPPPATSVSGCRCDQGAGPLPWGVGLLLLLRRRHGRQLPA